MGIFPSVAARFLHKKADSAFTQNLPFLKKDLYSLPSLISFFSSSLSRLACEDICFSNRKTTLLFYPMTQSSWKKRRFIIGQNVLRLVSQKQFNSSVFQPHSNDSWEKEQVKEVVLIIRSGGTNGKFRNRIRGNCTFFTLSRLWLLCLPQGCFR